jgi:PAS domain S-box-containing protein
MRFRLLLTGEERWAIVKSVPIRNEQGEVEYAASIFSDITERVRAEEALKASEARFQAFMHNAPVVAFMKDEAGRVVFLNHAWEQLFGIPVADALGKNDYDLQPPDLAEQFHSADMEVLETGKVKVIPESVPATDGTLRHWMTFKFPIVLPSGARFVGGASVDITERVRAEEELQRYAERLQALSRQLIEAQEAERRRIARDLHDQIGQALTAIKIDLQVAQHQTATVDEVPPAAAPGGARRQDNFGQSPHKDFAERLDRTIDMVERTIQQVREFSLDLRPSILDDLGLPSALLWYAEEQARRAGFTTELAVEQLPARLSPELEIACFRIAQEAITNVVRHARAAHVAVQLRRTDNKLTLVVSDDGAGFDLRALDSGPTAEVEGGSGKTAEARSLNRIKTLGLAGMNERVSLVGGSVSIRSAPGAGTTVRATFPIDGPRPKNGAVRGQVPVRD